MRRSLAFLVLAIFNASSCGGQVVGRASGGTGGHGVSAGLGGSVVDTSPPGIAGNVYTDSGANTGGATGSGGATTGGTINTGGTEPCVGCGYDATAGCADASCPRVCVTDARRCSGGIPQTCDADGRWESGVACPSSCAVGACSGKLACIGDSITQYSGWCEDLGGLLGARWTVGNYGASGTTLLRSGDFPYWSTQQFTDSHTFAADIVVIMLGTNDSKPLNWTAASKANFVTDYEALVDSYTSLASHPKVYLNLPPPSGTNGYGISGTMIENEELPLVRQVAEAKGTGLIDIFAAFGGHDFDASLYGSTADQVHPNAKGAQVIAETVHTALVSSIVGKDAGPL